MVSKNKSAGLAAFITYVLGRRPDEFGLISDEKGFFNKKEFLKAVREEEGWRHLKESSLNELILTMPEPAIEIRNDLIRAKDRTRLPEQSPLDDLPKMLYAGITRKSYRVVLEKGIMPTRHPYIILARDREMALRIAKRRDSQPVILTVNVRKAAETGVAFYGAGEFLCTATHVPAGCFTGPLMPKEKKTVIKPKKAKDEKSKAPAGSFILDLQENDAGKDKRHAKKNRSWKKNKKRMRREKKNDWPE